MNADDFSAKLRSCIGAGQVLTNPGGGRNKVISVDEEKTTYKRGKSRFYFPIDVLYMTYSRFSGNSVSSTDLKAYLPHMFDSKKNGHSCHCTFFLMVLREMNIVPAIDGRGRRGDPFNVEIPSR